MTFLNAKLEQLPAIEQAIAQHALSGVRIAPAFLGRVIVQCPDGPAAEMLKTAVPDLR